MTDACLYFPGNYPSTNDKVMSPVISTANVSAHVLITDVGMLSSGEDLAGINRITLSCVNKARTDCELNRPRYGSLLHCEFNGIALDEPSSRTIQLSTHNFRRRQSIGNVAKYGLIC